MSVFLLKYARNNYICVILISHCESGFIYMDLITN